MFLMYWCWSQNLFIYCCWNLMFCVLRVCFYFALWDSHIAIPLTISKLFNLHKTFVLRFIRRNCYEIMQRALVIMLVSFGIVTIYKTNMCYLPLFILTIISHHHSFILVRNIKVYHLSKSSAGYIFSHFFFYYFNVLDLLVAHI